MADIVLEAWAQLDQQVVEIVALTQERAAIDRGEKPANPTPMLSKEIYGAKMRARGKAEILALLMPNFADADAVAEESGRRYAAAVQGVPYTTPGLPS